MMRKLLTLLLCVLLTPRGAEAQRAVSAAPSGANATVTWPAGTLTIPAITVPGVSLFQETTSFWNGINVGNTGVTFTQGTGGQLVITGNGSGTDEALKLDLNVNNAATLTTTTGVTTFTFSGMNVAAPTFNGNTFTTGTGVLTLGAGKTATINNTLTFAGTDGTTMTFPATSATLARTDAANTFTGTQTVGALVATTVNGNTFTTGTGVLTIAAGKTLTASNSLTLAGTDATVMTFPTTSATIARTDAANTFTGTQTMTSPAFTTSATTGSTTFALLNTTATTVNAFGAATTLNIGASATQVLNFGGSTSASEFRFLEPSGSGTNYTSFKVAAQSANLAYTLPTTAPTDGQFLSCLANGTMSWGTPSGSGTVTVVGAGSLTSTALVTGGGTTTVQTPNALTTLDSSGNISTPGSITSGAGGSSAGFIALGQGTAPSAGTTNITLYAPASVTSYIRNLPGAAGTGFYLGTNSSGVVTDTQVGFNGTGNVIRAAGSAVTGITSDTLGLSGALTLSGGGMVITGGADAITFTGSGAENITETFTSNTLTFSSSTGVASFVFNGIALTTPGVTVTGTTVPVNGSYLPAANTLGWSANSAAEMQLTATALSPAADGGNSLGTTALGWQNLFGNTGFVVNIENGDWVATHTAGIMTVGTGDLRVTTAGTNAASAVTVGGTQTLTAKTLTSPVIGTKIQLPTAAGSSTLSTGGDAAYNTTNKVLGIHNGTKEVGVSTIYHQAWSFDPKAVCDGTIDRLFLMSTDIDSPFGIHIIKWKLSFEADPTTEFAAAACLLKRADAFIGVANAATVDDVATTAGASSEATSANINGDAVVATGKVIFLQWDTPYTETGHQVIFEMYWEVEED